VTGQDFLRVDGFLNHRIAPAFIIEAGRLLAEAFSPLEPSCVLTAEAAGNAIAYEVSRQLGICALYAKKGQAVTMAHPIARSLRSPTKGTEVVLSLSRDYVAGERILIVDDFLFRGTTSAALAEMVGEAGGVVVGFGFVIEKCFAGGREALSAYGIPIVTLVPILRMDGQRIVFED
jgi:xanthine phosphoribosyltransferase